MAEEKKADRKETVTLTFKGDDLEKYDSLLEDAKEERRTISQFLLMKVLDLD